MSPSLTRDDVAPPDEEGVRDGLHYALFSPSGTPRGGVVVIHGADSRKENHYDWGRECRAAGLAAVVYDQRGHGASPGMLDARAVDDVAAMAALLPAGPIGLRGSSMGGFLALTSAAAVDARAVVAICPAPGALLLRGLRERRFGFPVDAASLEPLLATADLEAAATRLGDALLLMHATGDDRVGIEHSDALHAASPASRFIRVPGGDHGSIQHDPELRGEAVRWLAARLVA
ncbi:alpha/beta hydrolase [Svornostia abyssi]|uniref:Alpha/beta hydrolase n=1 Tax=Svornostia abyssi TaxID=2898438 RepID=A0ABY5PF26_9ACTN|nr:alpha/beta hydrolase [Parviterribacteraceae bacterium J379]